jgi:hypothetical protein
MSIPYKVQIIEDFVKQVEARDMKLRVRVVEVGKFFNLHIVWYISCIFIYFYTLN